MNLQWLSLFIFLSFLGCQKTDKNRSPSNSNPLTLADAQDVSFVVQNVNRSNHPGRQTSSIAGEVFIAPGDDPSKPVSIALHGFASNNAVFSDINLHMINNGLVSRAYAINVPGQGAGAHRSSGAAGILNMAEHYYQVVEQIYAEVNQNLPVGATPRKIIVQGHSMGGLTSFLVLAGVRKLEDGGAVVDQVRRARLAEIIDERSMLWAPPLDWSDIRHYENPFYTAFYEISNRALALPGARNLRIPGLPGTRAPNNLEETFALLRRVPENFRDGAVTALAMWIKTYLPNNGVMFVSNMSVEEVKHIIVAHAFTGMDLRFAYDFASMLSNRAIEFGQGSNIVNIVTDIESLAVRANIISASRDDLAAALHINNATKRLRLNHFVAMGCSHLDLVVGSACYRALIASIMNIYEEQKLAESNNIPFQRRLVTIRPEVVPFERLNIRRQFINNYFNTCVDNFLSLPFRAFFSGASGPF